MPPPHVYSWRWRNSVKLMSLTVKVWATNACSHTSPWMSSRYHEVTLAKLRESSNASRCHRWDETMSNPQPQKQHRLLLAQRLDSSGLLAEQFKIESRGETNSRSCAERTRPRPAK